MNSKSKNKSPKSYITTDKLIESLKRLGIRNLPIETIRLWSRNEEISYWLDHRPPGRPLGGEKRKGPGRPEKLWPARIVEEAAAVWAVRRQAPRLSAKEVLQVQSIAVCLFATPQAEYSVPSGFRFAAPNPLALYDYRSLTLRLSTDDRLDHLARIWLGAFIKARNRVPVDVSCRIALLWRTRARVDQKKREEVPIDEISNRRQLLSLPQRTALDLVMLQLGHAGSCTPELRSALLSPTAFTEITRFVDGVVRDFGGFLALGDIFELEEAHCKEISGPDKDQIVILVDGVDTRKTASFYRVVDESITPERQLRHATTFET